MANYYTKCRSNFFAVTNIQIFKDICSRLFTESLNDCYETITDEEGEKVCFAFEGPFSYKHNPGDEKFANDSYEVFSDLQKILPDGECIIFTQIGWEKLRCITANSIIVTKDDIKYMDLSEIAINNARMMLSNPDYTPD